MFCFTDDIFIFGSLVEEHHEKTLRVVLNRIRKIVLRLKKENCKFSIHQVEFLRKIISKHNLSPSFKN